MEENLFKRLRRLKPQRKEYIIKPKVFFEADTAYYIFSILPTVIVQPWIYRYKGSVIIDITWLNLHIGIGEWTKNPNYKEVNNGEQ